MNGEHLSPKTRELLGRPIEERIAYIQLDSWIPYSQANKILQQLEDLLNHPKMRQDAELGDHGSNQQWQNAAHETFFITAPSQRGQRQDNRGASLLFAMPRHSRRIELVQRNLAEAVPKIPSRRLRKKSSCSSWMRCRKSKSESSPSMK